MAKASTLVPVFLVFAGAVPRVGLAAEPAGATAVLDYGVVHAGDVLAPCVRLENRSIHEIRVEHVTPPCPGPPFDVTLAPGEDVVRPLRAVDTSDFRGPMSKTYFLLVTPPGELEFQLLPTCAEGGVVGAEPGTAAD